MSNYQKGFSLIEILLVVTIIGIITVISIPWLQKAIGADENSSAFTNLKAISSLQIGYFAKHDRYGRLDELHKDAGDNLGTLTGSEIQMGLLKLTMNPLSSSDDALKSSYQIIATKVDPNGGDPCVLTLDASSVITEVFGVNCLADE